MKLAISNIAWDITENENVYQAMMDMGFSGIEIAPTKLFPSAPYTHLDDATIWSEEMLSKYGVQVASMQSIWYGRNENIFNSDPERKCLVEYTKDAIDFAKAIKCGNLVFGCPRNRNIGENAQLKDAVAFFREIGQYALIKGTTIGMEANPPIYNTNYINDTSTAIELIKEVDCKGFLLNLDFGTIIHNNESLDILRNNVDLINHVHISEPGLERIKERKEHKILSEILRGGDYKGFVSIEMKQQETIEDVFAVMNYVREVFA